MAHNRVKNRTEVIEHGGHIPFSHPHKLPVEGLKLVLEKNLILQQGRRCERSNVSTTRFLKSGRKFHLRKNQTKLDPSIKSHIKESAVTCSLVPLIQDISFSVLQLIFQKCCCFHRVCDFLSHCSQVLSQETDGVDVTTAGWSQTLIELVINFSKPYVTQLNRRRAGAVFFNLHSSSFEIIASFEADAFYTSAYMEQNRKIRSQEAPCIVQNRNKEIKLKIRYWFSKLVQTGHSVIC